LIAASTCPGPAILNGIDHPGLVPPVPAADRPRAGTGLAALLKWVIARIRFSAAGHLSIIAATTGTDRED
jgi:hypothetical protein